MEIRSLKLLVYLFETRSPRLFVSRNIADLRSDQKRIERDNKTLLEKAVNPYRPNSAKDLSAYLLRDVLYYLPGDLLAVNKPYGVSCLGRVQKRGGIFNSVIMNESDDSGGEFRRKDDDVTIEDALPFLKNHFNEPGLNFCTGLKRYVSGPILLPCEKRTFDKIRKSIYHSHLFQQNMHRALVICLSTPREAEGIVEGYATFQNSTKANEYIFVQNATINKRAKRGKYAVHVRVNYKVLATNHGCSLIDIHYSKFARHAPRLALLHLGCVILGDTLYSQRIIKVGEELAVVEPKDLYRVKNQEVFKPKEFYEWVGIKGMRDMGLHPPLFWTVYQTTYPMFGKTKEDRSLELVLRASPPDHFAAMIKLLDFETTMAKFFDRLQTCSDYIIPSNTSGDTKF